jgi:hypothetical protein
MDDGPNNVDLLVAIIRVEGKIDALSSTSSDHEVRLRLVERRLLGLPSIGAVCGMVGALTGVYAVYKG